MTDTRRVVVTGATGLIGKALCSKLVEQGYQVTILSRNSANARRSVPIATDYVTWNPSAVGDWATSLEGAYGVVHLAGASIFGKRWDERYKALIRDSRIVSTGTLVEAMGQLQQKPAVFVSGSAVGYYGDTGQRQVDEQAAPGNDFLARVCVDWEAEAAKAENLGIRTVMVRSGVVLDRREGALPLMVLPFRFFAGGPILPGNQWFSWVHIEDEIGIIMLALQDEQVRGPINATAPEPKMNRDFMKTLAKVVGTPSWLPVPGFGLHIVLGEFADQLTGGQRAVPKKAQERGYIFKHPTAEEALRTLLT